MSRLPIQARTISSLARPTFRSFSRFSKAYEEGPIQRVRIRRPYFSRRRLATWALYSSCIVAYVYYAMPISVEIEEDAGDQQERGGGEGEGEEGNDEEIELNDEGAIFIPLGFAKKKPKQYYRGSDPEWQEFIKLARDKKRHEAIQRQLVSYIANGVSRHKSFSQSLGGQQFRVGEYWLELVFPNGPPQEYEQTGVEIGDEYIAIATRDIDQIEYNRLHRALWPTGTLQSIYASFRVLFVLQWIRAKEMLGWQTQTPEQIQKVKRMMKTLKGVQQRDQQNANSRPGMPGFPRFPFPGVAAPPGTANQSPTSAPAPSGSTSANDSLPKRIPLAPADLTGMIPPSQDIPIALHIFNATMARKRRVQLEPPRGSCIVLGLIEILGKQAKTTLDVRAAYDIATGNYTIVQASVRTFKPFRQPPLGGL